ncbi:exodeoxyribonuclease V subunit alpha [Halomonas sp. AOP43-A1-21]|uniref:exodeoxyribonuclease V subunit alpha n=1 Tax=Halomonas TaxID=2745 RepID=UPI00186777A0|nr:exodeoxyribonuclease V subunit alpha [Halomonas colorata]
MKDSHTLDLFGENEPAPATPRNSTVAPDHQRHPALNDTGTLMALCERWVARGWLRDLDRALVSFFAREGGQVPPLLLLATALASHQLGRGHVCLDLNATLNAPDFALSLPPEGDDLSDPPPLPSEVLATLTLAEWQAALEHPTLISNGHGNTPLVRADTPHTTRLYLRRYWQYEQTLHQEIAARLALEDDAALSSSCGSPVHWWSDTSAKGDASHPLLQQALNTLFPDNGTLDWQKVACALAARSHFAIITGGPGTGKTTTVVRLLALLQTLQLAHSPTQALRIRLAAPTGKAAARLNESIAGQVSQLPTQSLATLLKQNSLQEPDSLWEPNSLGEDSSTEQLQASIPTEVTTLHRLLGARPDTRHFRHNPNNPLALDVLVIDEASMVDIEMMTAVLSALPAHAKLVLLGDKDQLASVEAGAVLGDLCRRAEAAHYTPETAKWLATLTSHPLPEALTCPNGQALDQAITMLRVSHRFDAASGIGQLAEAINQPLSATLNERNKQNAVHSALRAGYADLHHLVLGGEDDNALERLVVTGSPERFPNAGKGRMDKRSNQELAPPTGYLHYLTTLKKQRPDATLTFEDNRATYNAWASDVLKAYGHFQLLCALRKGPWGVEGLNLRIAKVLRREKLLSASDIELEKGWYEGRPVLVTQNDYSMGLMNGDIGITLTVPDPRTSGRLLHRVAFPTSDPENSIRWVLPSRLHSVETVFAMTVHKSQGSEFLHTALLLPQTPNPILTRELVYTGITRAREWLTLVEAKRGILNDAVVREVMRVSGMGD